ncbi:MAG: undecaprenyl diphosphate synthase family protein [Acidilobus sp.]
MGEAGLLLPSMIPSAIGIIPDGNRRWARKVGIPYVKAYREGYQRLRQTLRWILDEGVRRAVVYVLSRENCTNRPLYEREVLGNLLIGGLRDLRKDEVIHGEKIKVKVIGDLSLVSETARQEIIALEGETSDYSGGSLHMGICYSGEWERGIIASGLPAPSILAGVPEVDLIVRTGGMRRLSGFFPLQTTYAELYFTDTLWPDFNSEELRKAIEWFSTQKRNFGA